MRALCAAARRAASTEPLAFIVTARGAWHRVDMRHSAGVAGAALTRWCGSAIVGVINMERGRVLVSSLVFRLSSNFGRTTDSDSVNPGSSPGGRAEKHTRSRVGTALFLSLALCPSGLGSGLQIRARRFESDQRLRRSKRATAALPVW